MVAQLVEQRPFKPWVPGSSPGRLTTPSRFRLGRIWTERSGDTSCSFLPNRVALNARKHRRQRLRRGFRPPVRTVEAWEPAGCVPGVGARGGWSLSGAASPGWYRPVPTDPKNCTIMRAIQRIGARRLRSQSRLTICRPLAPLRHDEVPDSVAQAGLGRGPGD